MQAFWYSLVAHRSDILWAAVVGLILGGPLAFMAALLLEILPPNSRARIGIRNMQNTLAERSAAKIRKRIAGLEQYRDTLVTDKAHYLTALGFVLGILLMLSLGASVFLLGRIELLARFIVPGSFDMLALACFIFAILFAVIGIKFASLRTQDKIRATIAGIDSDIAKLRGKLPAT